MRKFNFVVLFLVTHAVAMQQDEQSRCLMVDGEGKDECGRSACFVQVALARPDLLALTIKNTQLCFLPEGIAKFRELRSLDVSGNELSDDSADIIGALPHLRYLDISRNKFTTLPEPIARLPHVRCLRAAENRMVRVPACVRTMRRLRTLDLMANDIKSIDPAIGQLQDLEDLYLDDNLLQRLPASLRLLDNLTVLSLTHNFFKRQPRVLNELCGGAVAIDPSDLVRRHIDHAVVGPVVVYYDQASQVLKRHHVNSLLRASEESE